MKIFGLEMILDENMSLKVYKEVIINHTKTK